MNYTVTITDTGQTGYSGISVADDLTEVLADAAYDGDAAATAGSVSFAGPVLTWTGSLSAGGTVTVTFSVTVNNPDTGDRRIVNRSPTPPRRGRRARPRPPPPPLPRPGRRC